MHRDRCVWAITWGYFTPLTAGSIISPAYRSRSLWCKVVVERCLEDDRDGLQNKVNAAELQLERLRHAELGVEGHSDGLGSVWRAACRARARA